MDWYSYGNDRWKIIYGSLADVEGNAVKMLYKGVMKEVPYILVAEAAEKEMDLSEYSIVLVGTRRSNCLLEEIIGKDEIPQNGYMVRVTRSPFATERQIAIVAGDSPTETIYAASHFINQYFPVARRREDHIPYFRPLFSGKMKEYDVIKKPAFEKRGIWTWGHCIYNYNDFACNMAGLGLNTITIWNDYAPVNLSEVVSCFHSYGIKVLLGYSWGWDEQLDISMEAELEKWKRKALETYENQYAGAGADGIYIQSFTETCEEEKNGVLIADRIVKWVNTLSGALLERWPELQICFGLHATSVKNHLSYLSDIDPKINIHWEDCGAFPFAYLAHQTKEEEKMLGIVDTIAKLRPDCEYGVVLKGQVCLDWSMFEHQKGPYLLGCAGKKQIKRRRAELEAQWHDVQSGWIKNFGQYRRTLEHLPGAEMYALVEDALLEEGCWYPTALYAQALWDTTLSDEELLGLVAQREDVIMV